MSDLQPSLGLVISGTLSGGLTVRLAADRLVEQARVGTFVTVEGRGHRFFGLVTDVQLAASNQQVLLGPPDPADSLAAAALEGTATYGTIEVAPMLMLACAEGAAPQPVKTVPAHFSPVAEADEADFALIFGQEDATHFTMGTPVDMPAPVCLDLPRLVERSNGVFGKSGTGKTFLTRLLLVGLIHKRQGTCLVFDMHNEYGAQTQSEGGTFVKGLKQLFPAQVRIFTLDEVSTTRRNVHPDHVVSIPTSAIEVEDLLLLGDELRLNRTFAESAYLLAKKYGDEWLAGLLSTPAEQLSSLAEELGAAPESLAALYRKLDQVDRLPFVTRGGGEDSIKLLIDELKQGHHVVLEFGRQRRLLAYMLVANILTRRIHREWVEQTERYQSSQNEKDAPRQLVICLEEAHNFLSPSVARQSTFGDIAREMRKYSVTLLVVDQRPSQIDPEVMSQLGTRVTALLNDDSDIQAVLTGVSGAANLRGVLARLDSKQQALLLGHAVPMPVVIRTRDYGPALYQECGSAAGEGDFDRMVKELYPQ